MVADMITCRCSFARLARLTVPAAMRCGAMAPDDIPFASRRCGAMVADMITCRCSFARLARLTLYRLPCAVRDGSR